MASLHLITPDWPAPRNVRALCTTRQGGASRAPYDTFNLGSHVGDDVEAVLQNRQHLASALALPASRFHWLEQVHGVELLGITEPTASKTALIADGSWTRHRGQACVVMTADCLPVLLTTRQGDQVAAVHAGWRGLQSGIIERALETFSRLEQVLAWLGPAIGPRHFEVGGEVRQAFLEKDSGNDAYFSPSGTRQGHWLADLYGLARRVLQSAGVQGVWGGNLCTYSQRELFYSYRRDRTTGRMASLIWFE